MELQQVTWKATNDSPPKNWYQFRNTCIECKLKAIELKMEQSENLVMHQKS